MPASLGSFFEMMCSATLLTTAVMMRLMHGDCLVIDIDGGDGGGDEYDDDGSGCGDDGDNGDDCVDDDCVVINDDDDDDNGLSLCGH